MVPRTLFPSLWYSKKRTWHHFSFRGLELREEDHVADRRAVGEEHHEAVDADAFPGRGRQPVLERANVVGVVIHGFLVARFLGARLRGEPRGLVVGVVQLGKAVGDLASGDEELE